MPSSGLIERVQALRFFAAAFVLVGHVIMETLQHPQIQANAQFDPASSQIWVFLRSIPWGSGVDIFFVISGFIISYSSLQRPASLQSSADFLIRRIIRIWPTYAFFTGLMLIANLVFRSVLTHPNLDPMHIATSFLFIPWVRPDDGRMFPLLGQGWTLNYEMFFYACFALALLLPRKMRVQALVGGGLLLILAGFILPLPKILAFYANPIIAEFLCGILLGVGFRHWPASPRGGMAMIAGGIALLYGLYGYNPELPRLIGFGLPAVLIVGGVLVWGEPGERLLGRPGLVLLGNASYALYLSHPFVTNALVLVWLKLRIGAPWLFFSAAIASSVLTSVIVYRMLERPMLDALGRAYSRFRVRKALAIAS